MRNTTLFSSRKFLFFLAFLLLSLAGCSLAPEYNRPPSPVPPTINGQVDQGGISGNAFSINLTTVNEYFPEPRLQALISLAIKNNRDLALAALNIEEALSRLGIAQAERLPMLDATLSEQFKGSQNDDTSSSYTAELMVPSFELDFFGKFKNMRDSKMESYRSSRENYLAFRISLVSAVALAYLEERLAAQKTLLAERTIKSFQDAYAFMESRVVGGQATLLELEQARGQLQFAETELLSLRVERMRAQNNLELLTGVYNESALPEPYDLLAWQPKAITGPIPSSVLLLRPDVLAAEHDLIAAHYDIGVARAQFFPSISLTGTLGFMSGEFSNLFVSKDSVWSLTPGINLPLFRGGRNLRDLELAYTAKDKLTLAYEKTIQTAFKETADALLPQEDLFNLIALRERYLNTQRRVLELSKDRYLNGAISYLEVLDAQRNVFAAEMTLLEAKASWLMNSVNLYAALGGGISADTP